MQLHFIIACVFLGVVLGSFLIYFSQGEFPYVGLVVGLIVAVILTIIEVLKQNNQKDHVPKADAKTIRNVFRFFAYTSHISLAVLIIGVTVFMYFEKVSISIYYLWLFIFAYLCIVGIGGLIVKRK